MLILRCVLLLQKICKRSTQQPLVCQSVHIRPL